MEYMDMTAGDNIELPVEVGCEPARRLESEEVTERGRHTNGPTAVCAVCDRQHP